MINELIICVLSILVLWFVNKYIFFLALLTCTCLAYCFVRYFSYTVNQRISRIAHIWFGISYCCELSNKFYRFCRQLFSSKRNYVTKSLQPPIIEPCADELKLENEINTLVQNITQFYLCSWYEKISDNEEFITILNCSIRETLLRLCSSVSKVEKKKFSHVVLQLYLHFFSHFVDAKKSSENFNWDNFPMKHWALKDSSTEWCYLQSLISSLLDKFGPRVIENSLHSKYSPLLHTIVVEILAETVLQPLVKALCDPSHINSLILRILQNCLETNEVLNTVQSTSKVIIQPAIVLPSENVSIDVSENYRQLSPQNQLSIPTMCDTNPSDPISFPSTSLQYSDENSPEFSHVLSSGVKSSSNSSLSDFVFSELKQLDEDENSPLTYDSTIIKRSKSADYIRQMPLLKALNEKDYDIKLQRGKNNMLVAVKLDSNSSFSIEQAEEAIEVEVPTFFTDVKITDTVQQTDEGLPPYTLYCIEYSGIFHDTGNSSDTPHFVTQAIAIKRRFREFVALQSRLEDNSVLKDYLKGIKGPSKWLTLPFSNLEKKNIAERKVFLEGYLKELCDLAPIAQSAELQEFLAYGGDARISFARKTGDINVPRIDKFLVRGVKGAIDMFKIALPNTPAEIDGMLPLRTALEDIYSDQRFQEHLLDFSSREPEIKEHLKNYYHYHELKRNPSGLAKDSNNSDSRIKKSSLLRNLSNFKTEECCTCVGTHDNYAEEDHPFGITIIEFIDIALNVNALTRGNFLTRLVLSFAPFINRCMIDKIEIVSDQHLASALHALHMYLWPSEINIEEPNTSPDTTSNLDKIIELLEDFLSSKYFLHNYLYSFKSSIIEKVMLFIMSLQHDKANKCLLFHLFDVVIEHVCSTEE